MKRESFNISWNMFDINDKDGWGIGYCQHNSKHCAFASFPVDALSKMSCMIIQHAIVTDDKCSDGGWCLNGDCEYSKLTREQALSEKIKGCTMDNGELIVENAKEYKKPRVDSVENVKKVGESGVAKPVEKQYQILIYWKPKK